MIVRLFLLMRPKGAGLVAALPLSGLGFGLWERGSTASFAQVVGRIGILFAAWLVGSAGAMWLNAELDRDQGAVLLGRAVTVPRGTKWFGYAALAASVLIAAPLGTVAALCTAGCAALSVLYSHPATALKGRALGGPLVNIVGYGVLSPIAGWSTADVPFTWRAAYTLGLIVLLVGGMFFSAQAFQRDEDRERGYRTFVVTHGPRATLSIARACFAVGAVGVLVASAFGFFPRALLVSVPLFMLVDRHIARWMQQPNGGDSTWASKLIGVLALALLTLLGAAYADHFSLMLAGAPAGGCGTAIVPAALSAVCG